MPVSHLKIVVFSAVIVGAAIAFSFFDGSIIINYLDFHKGYSIVFCLEFLLSIFILIFLFFYLIDLVLNIPRKFGEILGKRQTKKIEQIVINEAMKSVFSKSNEFSLFEKIRFGGKNLNEDVLLLMLADKMNFLEKIESFSKKFSNKKRTELLGKIYLSKYYYNSEKFELSLDTLLSVIKNLHHVKEDLYFKNFIFQICIGIAEKGKFEKNQTKYYEIYDKILNDVRLSQLLSIQANFEKEHETSKEGINSLQKMAYKLDKDNVEALAYAPHVMEGMTFEEINKELVCTFYRNPHAKIIETLIQLNTVDRMPKIFALLQNNLPKTTAITPEMLYCIAKVAINAKSFTAAHKYINELDRVLNKKISPRVWFLKIDIEKINGGLSDEVFNIQNEIIKSHNKDVFRCRECSSDFAIHTEYCKNCGAIRSLDWKVLQK
jgi:hypothetical protein